MFKSSHFLAVMIILLLAALTALTLPGSYTRMHADDFCIAADARQMDMRSLFKKWYQGWTGRFIYIPTAGILALGGPQMASLLPPISVAGWFIILSWAALPGFKFLRWPHPSLHSCVYAGFFLLLLLSTTPNLFQSVFWKDGLINYSFPLIGMTLSIGLMLRIWLNNPKKGLRSAVIAIIFLCSFVNSGFSEIFSTTQIAVYMIFIITGLWFLEKHSRRSMLPLFFAGLLGSLCAYAIMLAAPGNLIRQGLITDHPNLIRLLTFSMHSALVIIVKFFVFTPLWAVLSILVPLLSGFSLCQQPLYENKKKHLSWLWLHGWFKAGVILPMMTFIFTMATCAPVVYMLNAYPDDRTIIIPLYFIVAAVTISSGLFGYGLRRLGLLSSTAKKINLQHLSYALVILLLLAGTTLIITNTLEKINGFQDYAFRWDQRHEELLQKADKGIREATAYGLENRFGISDLQEEADYWVNRCMADYYGFTSIIGQ